MKPATDTDAVIDALAPNPVVDRLGRPLQDLRLSVLDRCNLRCEYCMPADSLPGRGVFLERESLLSDDELVLLVRVFVKLGVHKVRLTGGEPLLRPGLHRLVRRIAGIEGVDDLALTSNGILLPQQADALRRAGLGRITVSLDSLDDEVFRRMSGGRGNVNQVLDGIRAAEEAGFSSIKINTVVQRDVNEAGVEALVEHFRGTGHVLRMIEFMDVGNINHWSEDQVVPSAELLTRIHRRWPLKPVAGQVTSETARRFAFEDGAGEIGFISSITQPFCGGCTRARVAADGTFYSCLFSGRGTALRPIIRQTKDVRRLRDYLAGLWSGREDRYSEQRNRSVADRERVEMFRVGG